VSWNKVQGVHKVSHISFVITFRLFRDCLHAYASRLRKAPGCSIISLLTHDRMHMLTPGTACVLGNFCRPNVLCGQAFVCRVYDAADCTVVSPLTEVEAVRAVLYMYISL